MLLLTERRCTNVAQSDSGVENHGQDGIDTFVEHAPHQIGWNRREWVRNWREWVGTGVNGLGTSVNGWELVRMG
jgi:hypothetical protein